MAFYKTRFTIDVISPKPLELTEPSELVYAITEGDCMGSQDVQGPSEPIDAQTVARLAWEWGGSPEFFGLTDSGEPIDAS